MAQPLPTPHHPGGRVQTMKQGFEQHILTFNATSVRGLGSCFALHVRGSLLKPSLGYRNLWSLRNIEQDTIQVSNLKYFEFEVFPSSMLFCWCQCIFPCLQIEIHENWANHFVHKVKSTWGSTTSFSVRFQILLLMLNKLIEINNPNVKQIN